MTELVKVTVDGREALVPKGAMIVEAAKQVDVNIPVFCHHEKLRPVGACRMCLVEIEKVPRLQTACTTPVTDGMVVKTDTPAVVKAQQGILEFLLTNHPLDCPVCDKGGECPLQDTTFKYGCDRSRFAEEKRHSSKAVHLSPLIVQDRERCIMCTRCARFQREIAGDESLTTVNRGAQSYVGVLPGRSFDSPFSGNTIELCPVGALTSAKFRFKARSWEVKKTPSVCSLCSVGCNIKIETRSGQLLRLTSRENPGVDDGWLCDWGRFTYEFVNDPARLRSPFVRRNGELVPATWEEALSAVAEGLRRAGESVGGVISAGSTNEELYLFQKLFRTVLRSNNVDHGLHGHYNPPETGVDAASRSIASLESAALILLAGVDPLVGQPVLDLRLKKAVNKKGARLVSLGSKQTDLAKLSRPWLRVSEGSEAAAVNGLLHLLLHDESTAAAARERLGGRYAAVVQAADEYPPERVQEVAGVDAESLREAARLLAATSKVAILFPRPLPGEPEGLREACGRLALATGGLVEEGGGLYPLGSRSNSQGSLDLGVAPNLLPGQRTVQSGNLDYLQRIWGVRPAETPGMSGRRMLEAAAEGKLQALYLVGADPLGQSGAEQAVEALSRVDLLVVQDIFMTPTARAAHVVLPGVSFAEKEGSFTNLERRVQRLQVAVAPPGVAMPDWQVIARVANALEAGWSYAAASEVFGEMVAATPLYEGLRYEELGPRGRRWRYPGAEEAEEPRNGRLRRLWYQPIPVESSGA